MANLADQKIERQSNRIRDAHSGSGPDPGATHHDTVVHLPAAGGGARQKSKTGSNGEGGTFVKSEDFAQSGPSIGTCVKSEDFAQSGPGPDSGATHHDTDAALPAADGGAHKRHLTSQQVVDIFKFKTSKTTLTCSMLSEKYGVCAKTIRSIWNLKSWVPQTRPFWTPEDEQQSLASGTRVESEDSAQSGPGGPATKAHQTQAEGAPSTGGSAGSSRSARSKDKKRRIEGALPPGGAAGSSLSTPPAAPHAPSAARGTGTAVRRLCEHNRQKSRCMDCSGGSGLCEHKRQKSQCRDCGGSGLCEHKRQKSL